MMGQILWAGSTVPFLFRDLDAEEENDRMEDVNTLCVVLGGRSKPTPNRPLVSTPVPCHVQA